MGPESIKPPIPSVGQVRHRRPYPVDGRLAEPFARPRQAEDGDVHTSPLERQDLADDERLRQPWPASDEVDHSLRHRSPLVKAWAAPASRFARDAPCPGPLPSTHCLAILSQL